MKLYLFMIISLLAGCIDNNPHVGYIPINLIELTPTGKVYFSAIKYNGLTERDDHEAIKNIVSVDPRKVEWCAAFINAVLEENGLEGTSSLLAKSFLDWGNEVDVPRKGDIVVFERGGSASWKGHVGFFVADVGDKIIVFGGNQDDEISFAEFSKSKILSFRRN